MELIKWAEYFTGSKFSKHFFRFIAASVSRLECCFIGNAKLNPRSRTVCSISVNVFLERLITIFFVASFLNFASLDVKYLLYLLWSPRNLSVCLVLNFSLSYCTREGIMEWRSAVISGFKIFGIWKFYDLAFYYLLFIGYSVVREGFMMSSSASWHQWFTISNSLGIILYFRHLRRNAMWDYTWHCRNSSFSNAFAIFEKDCPLRLLIASFNFFHPRGELILGLTGDMDDIFNFLLY